MAREGLVRTVHGRGTVRLPPPVALRVGLGSFAHTVTSHGMTPSTRALELVRDTGPPEEVRRFLRLRRRQGAVRLRRLRLGDDIPLALERTWLVASRVGRLTTHDAQGSLYTFLSERGLSPDVGEERVLAGLPEADEADLLEIPSTRPVLRLTRFASSAGRAVEYSQAAFPADRYELSFPLQARGPVGG